MWNVTEDMWRCVQAESYVCVRGARMQDFGLSFVLVVLSSVVKIEERTASAECILVAKS